MSPARWLIDKSAVHRLSRAEVARAVQPHTVLHHDADFETIADVTDQPTRWVVPRGSVP